MKIVMCNKSGSVGKTTLTAHLFHPNLTDAPIYAVESSNSTAAQFGLEVITYDALQFKEILADIFTRPSAILDIGGSKNFSDFYDKMTEGDFNHMEFDYFIVPVIPNEKAEKEAIATLIALQQAGVEAERIRVVYNQAAKLSTWEMVPGAVKEFGIKTATVGHSDIFGILANLKISINALENDSRDAMDYKKEAITHEKGSAKFMRCFDMYYAKGGYSKLKAMLDKAWTDLELA